MQRLCVACAERSALVVGVQAMQAGILGVTDSRLREALLQCGDQRTKRPIEARHSTAPPCHTGNRFQIPRSSEKSNSECQLARPRVPIGSPLFRNIPCWHV